MITPAQEDDVIQRVLLTSHVKKLPAKERAIIGLLMSGYRQEEAANILGISSTAVGNAYRDTLKILQKRLSQE